MSKTKTSGATAALNLVPPPKGGDLSIISTLEEDAHYLRVTLDKSENFKVAAGERLRDMLVNKFAGNRNALRDWYEENVAQGKEHRAWSVVDSYLGTVLKYGEGAAEAFAKQRETKRQRDHEYDVKRGRIKNAGPSSDENINENNGVSGLTGRDERTYRPAPASEYDRRKAWLSDMNHLWFKGSREWQDKWLQDRRLLRERGSD